jgi:hypothetical protein
MPADFSSGVLFRSNPAYNPEVAVGQTIRLPGGRWLRATHHEATHDIP